MHKTISEMNYSSMFHCMLQKMPASIINEINSAFIINYRQYISKLYIEITAIYKIYVLNCK